MRLIPEWKRAYKFFSVQAGVIGSSICFGYISMYDKLKDSLAPQYMAAITGAVFVITIVVRIVSQEEKK